MNTHANIHSRQYTTYSAVTPSVAFTMRNKTYTSVRYGLQQKNQYKQVSQMCQKLRRFPCLLFPMGAAILKLSKL
jgi:hypothetical protein